MPDPWNMKKRLSLQALTRWTSGHFLGPATLVLGVLALVVNETGYQSVERLDERNTAILRVRILTNQVQLTTLMMESSMRGYMLTQRDAYLEPYTEMDRQFEPLLEQVQAMAESYPEQRDKLEALSEAARRKRSEMIEVLTRFQSGNPERAMDLTLTEIGRENMVRIHEIADQLRREETEAYNRVTHQRNTLRYWSRIGIAGLVLLCVAAEFAVLRLIGQRERYLALLRAERDNLEIEVDRRTSELTDLAQHMQRVREDERSHLARELHDELGGLLTSAKLDIARVKNRVADRGPEVAERIQHLTQMLDAVIALKRRIIEDLRPSSLSNLGLQRTLEIQCSEFAERSDIAVQAEIADLELDPERALAVYRLVQETLTNVAKYARASEVSVLLQRHGAFARLQVRDNGCGFDLNQVRPGSHGLAGMRFRARSCGGELVLRTALGQGTTIEATLPI